MTANDNNLWCRSSRWPRHGDRPGRLGWLRWSGGPGEVRHWCSLTLNWIRQLHQEGTLRPRQGLRLWDLWRWPGRDCCDGRRSASCFSWTRLCIHQVDKTLLCSRVVVLREVFLDQVCIHQVDAALVVLSRSRRADHRQVFVDVIMQLECFQIQFIDRLLNIPVAHRQGYAQCAVQWSTFLWTAATSSSSSPVSCANCSENRRDSTGAVLGKGSWRARCDQVVGRDSWGFIDSVQWWFWVASLMVFRPFLGHFSHSVRLDVECLAGCDFFRALGGQQLLFVEGSSVLCIINFSDLWTYTSRLSQPVSKTTRLDTPWGRRSVGALSLLPLGILLGSTKYCQSNLWWNLRSLWI